MKKLSLLLICSALTVACLAQTPKERLKKSKWPTPTTGEKPPVQIPSTTESKTPPFGMQMSLPYKNYTLPTEDRVKDLLSRMTLEEKVAQIQCHWETAAPGTTTTEKGEIDYAKLAKFAPNGLEIGRAHV